MNVQNLIKKSIELFQNFVLEGPRIQAVMPKPGMMIPSVNKINRYRYNDHESQVRPTFQDSLGSYPTPKSRCVWLCMCIPKHYFSQLCNLNDSVRHCYENKLKFLFYKASSPTYLVLGQFIKTAASLLIAKSLQWAIFYLIDTTDRV